MTVAPARPHDRITLNADGTLSGRARGVPFAPEAEHIAVLADSGSGPPSRWSTTKDCRVTTDAIWRAIRANAVTFERVKPLQHRAAPAGLDQTR